MHEHTWLRVADVDNSEKSSRSETCLEIVLQSLKQDTLSLLLGHSGSLTIDLELIGVEPYEHSWSLSGFGYIVHPDQLTTRRI